MNIMVSSTTLNARNDSVSVKNKIAEKGLRGGGVVTTSLMKKEKGIARGL
jgi:hypothetical protein